MKFCILKLYYIVIARLALNATDDGPAGSGAYYHPQGNMPPSAIAKQSGSTLLSFKAVGIKSVNYTSRCLRCNLSIGMDVTAQCLLLDIRKTHERYNPRRKVYSTIPETNSNRPKSINITRWQQRQHTTGVQRHARIKQNLDDFDLGDTWFQKNRTTCHPTCRTLLGEKFNDCLISKNAYGGLPRSRTPPCQGQVPIRPMYLTLFQGLEHVPGSTQKIGCLTP